MRNRNRGRKVMAHAFGAALVSALTFITASAAHAADRCSDVTLPVSLSAGLPKTLKIYGRLCLPAGAAPNQLQILVHGSNYDHNYWDFPGFGQRYSYAHAMAVAGRATLAIDQLGVGRSSHPAGLLVTLSSNANALHDVVTAARAGALGSRFGKVVLVGHSFGSLMAFQEAATFNDVDGILASGFSHSSGAPYLLQVVSLTRPAKLDPVVAPRIPLLTTGYVSIPGARAKLFYYLPGADAAVLDQDEATRSESSLGDALSSIVMPNTSGIGVPVFIMDGAYDMPFCKQGGAGSTTDCSSDATLRAAEAGFFAPAAQLEAAVIPNSGHSINLHYNADTVFSRALDWFARYFPL